MKTGSTTMSAGANQILTARTVRLVSGTGRNNYVGAKKIKDNCIVCRDTVLTFVDVFCFSACFQR